MTEETTVTESTSTEAASPSLFSNPEKGFTDPKAFAAEIEKAINGADDNAPEEKTTEAGEGLQDDGEQEAATTHDDDIDDDEEMPERGAVPKSRFKKAVDKKNEYKNQAQTEREQRLILQKQYDSLQEALKASFGPAEQHQSEATDLDPLDPETTNALNKKIKALEDKQNQIEQASNTKAAQSAFADALRASQETFEKSTPDFKDSYNHVRHQIYNENLALGMDSADAERNMMISLQQIAARAIQVDKNPAEIIYNMAKNRGYAKVADKKTGPDINKIAKNMQKSSAINDMSPPNTAAQTGYNAEMIPQLAKKPGAFIDGAKFKQMLANVNK